MLSESWLKDKHPCLVYVKVLIRDKKKSLRRRLMMIKTKDQMTLIAKMYMLKIAQKNLNIHAIIHHIRCQH